MSGSKGQGGAGGGSTSLGENGGGGGGGGYYGGGGGGGGYVSGGGGGSDFLDPCAADPSIQHGANTGNGAVTVDFSSADAGDAQAAGATCCPRTPKITGTATRDTFTGDVTIDLSASGLGKSSQCGRAKMSITDPGHGTLYLQVNQNGSTATAHRVLAGTDQCLDITRATVSVPKGGTAHRNVLIPDSHISIVTLRARRTPQGNISLTVKANHFLPACGKRDFSWQSSEGSDTLPVFRMHGSTATAKRTLPSGQDCAPDGTILVVQPRDQWSRAQRQVNAPTPPPALCKGQDP